MVEKYQYVIGIQCPVCEEKIWSRQRHDFRPCGCMYSYIDGGRDYTRRIWGCSGPLDSEDGIRRDLTTEDYEIMNEFNKLMGPPNPIRIRVYE